MASDESLVAATERAVHLIGVYLAHGLADLDITQAEAHVLARLGRAGQSSPSELHRAFGHKRSTLTSVLDRLERRGLIARTINPDDRRSFIVSLTARGNRAAAKVSETVATLERGVKRRASAADVAGFASTIAALEHAVAAALARSD